MTPSRKVSGLTLAAVALALATLPFLSGAGVLAPDRRSPEIVVAASNAPARVRAAADYACTAGANTDQVQINAAIDLATTLGGVVHLSGGTFACKGPVVLKSTVTLRGEGWGTIIKHVPVGSGTISGISIANPAKVTTAAAHGLTTAQYVIIRGVTGDATTMTEVNDKTFAIIVTSPTEFTIGSAVTGTWTGGGTVAEIHDTVTASSISKFAVRDLQVWGDRGTSGNSNSDKGCAFSIVASTDGLIEHVWGYSGAAQGITVNASNYMGGTTGSDITVQDSKFSDNWHRGVHVQGAVSHIRILRNLVTLNHFSGMLAGMNGVQDLLVEGNTFLNNGDYLNHATLVDAEICVFNNEGNAALLPGSGRRIIRANTIIRNDTASKYDSTNGSAAIKLSCVDGCIIDGNTIDVSPMTKSYGIQLTGPCIGNVVAHNRVKAATYAVLISTDTAVLTWTLGSKGKVCPLGHWCKNDAGTIWLKVVATTGDAVAGNGAEPTWGTVEGAEITDGNVTWRVYTAFAPMFNEIVDNPWLENTLAGATHVIGNIGAGLAHDNIYSGNIILAQTRGGIGFAGAGEHSARIVGNTITVAPGADYTVGGIVTLNAANSNNLVTENRVIMKTGTAAPINLAGSNDQVYGNDCTVFVSNAVTSRGDVTGAGVVVTGKCTAQEFSGPSGVRKTVLTFTLTGSNTLNVATGANYGGGVKVYDFPLGRIAVLGVVVDGSCTATGLNVDPNDTYELGLGTTAKSTADAALAGTEIDFAPAAAFTQAAASDWHTALATTTVREWDGTGTAVDLYVNVHLVAASKAGANTFSITKTVTILWMNLGTY